MISLAPPLPFSGGNTERTIEHLEGQVSFSPLGMNSSLLFPALLITILSGLHNSTVSEDSLMLNTYPIS